MHHGVELVQQFGVAVILQLFIFQRGLVQLHDFDRQVRDGLQEVPLEVVCKFSLRLFFNGKQVFGLFDFEFEQVDDL